MAASARSSCPSWGKPTFYVGKRDSTNADQLRDDAEELKSAGWDVVLSETSQAAVHVKSVGPDKDLMALRPLLLTAYRGAGGA